MLLVLQRSMGEARLDKSLLSELFALWSQAEVEGSRDGYAPPKVTQHTKEL